MAFFFPGISGKNTGLVLHISILFHFTAVIPIKPKIRDIFPKVCLKYTEIILEFSTLGAFLKHYFAVYFCQILLGQALMRGMALIN